MRYMILDSNPIIVLQEEFSLPHKEKPMTSREERIVQEPVGIKVIDVWEMESIDTHRAD
jgi:hypothetical protein